jgi:hypothetical protein
MVAARRQPWISTSTADTGLYSMCALAAAPVAELHLER